MFFLTDALVIGLRAIGFVALFQAAGAALFLTLYERDIARPSADKLRLWKTQAGMRSRSRRSDMSIRIAA